MSMAAVIFGTCRTVKFHNVLSFNENVEKIVSVLKVNNIDIIIIRIIKKG